MATPDPGPRRRRSIGPECRRIHRAVPPSRQRRLRSCRCHCQTRSRGARRTRSRARLLERDTCRPQAVDDVAGALRLVAMGRIEHGNPPRRPRNPSVSACVRSSCSAAFHGEASRYATYRAQAQYRAQAMRARACPCVTSDCFAAKESRSGSRPDATGRAAARASANHCRCYDASVGPDACARHLYVSAALIAELVCAPTSKTLRFTANNPSCSQRQRFVPKWDKVEP